MSMKPILWTKLTAAGNIKGSAGYLVWIQVSNTTGNGLKAILNNATSGTGTEVMQIGVPGDDSKFLYLGSNFHLGTGIRFGTVESGLIVTGGYV